MFPKHNFQKYLDNEISKEQFKDQIRSEIINRAGLFALVNAFFFALISWDWSDEKYWTFSVWWQGFLVMMGIYFVVAVIGYYLSYGKTKRDVDFLIEIHEENVKKINNKAYLPKEQLKNKWPLTMRKLYLEDKISKEDFIRKIFEVKLLFSRIIFIAFIVGFSFVAIGIEDKYSITTKISGVYLISVFLTWIIQMEFGDLFFANLSLTLDQKEAKEGGDFKRNLNKLS